MAWRSLPAILLFGLAACAGQSIGGDIRAGQDGGEPMGQPIIGWQCRVGRILPGARRAALHAPTVAVPSTGDTAGPYEFILYKDDPVPVDAYVSWSVPGDTLDESPNRITLYFTLHDSALRDGELILESEDGARIRVPVNAQSATVVNTSPKSTAINITDMRLANAVLKHGRYRVFHQRGPDLIALKPVELFSFAEAVSLYAELLPALKREMRVPEQSCGAVRAPEDDPGAIV
ncbi:hypothetical protein OF829_03110 [Sphingomonas sp. LB-2]|uniref:hypothetical protein n=1 Tax=Sphingomonas caeni TaxID=2984949 RepID=UPI00222FB99E|nr:hypothetical protein [Sphingomonas caeni]MCW3846213.1 hypothetical protein [Sphingomonas caeni]